MPPHEETWELAETKYGNGTRVSIRRADGFTIAVFQSLVRPEVRRPNAALCSAAPDMARALIPIAERRCDNLLALGEACSGLWPRKPAGWCSPCCARAALTKGGVPLP